MGKTRPPERSKLDRRKKKLLADKKRKSRPEHTPAELLTQASILLQQSDLDSALEVATTALRQLKASIVADEDVINCLPALNLLGEINVELGELDAAREYFGQAAQIDEDGDIPEEKGGGPDKFLWLAQLSEEGGLDSVKWYRRAADVLREQIQSLDDEASESDNEAQIEEKQGKLANALCAVAEVYMTDLSWNDEAEEVCNRLMKEALSISPNNPETLQTAASVRISQLKKDDARQYLTKSLNLWKNLPANSPQIPEFAVRISLARLLMEAEMEDDAMEVIEKLIQEDDHSVEAWYLGGWCLYLISEKQNTALNGSSKMEAEESKEIPIRSRKWLLQCLKLYDLLDYEDEPLQEHANELVESLNKVLGPPNEAEDQAEEEEGEDWESADRNADDDDKHDDSDEDMEE
jgi:tetratricopeptide (TPR) repeat protein